MRYRYYVEIVCQPQRPKNPNGSYMSRVDMPIETTYFYMYADSEEQIREMLAAHIVKLDRVYD